MIISSQPETFSNLLNLWFLEKLSQNASPDENAEDKQRLFFTFEVEEGFIEEILNHPLDISTELLAMNLQQKKDLSQLEEKLLSKKKTCDEEEEEEMANLQSMCYKILNMQ